MDSRAGHDSVGRCYRRSICEALASGCGTACAPTVSGYGGAGRALGVYHMLRYSIKWHDLLFG